MNIKLYKEIGIFLLIFLFSLFFMMLNIMSLNNFDYIWNYGFSAKISLGLLPYRDFDLLQTPLSFYLTALFLKLAGNYIVVYAAFGAFAIAFMYYLFYLVLLRINNDKQFSIIVLLIAAIYTMANFTIYNYNILSVVIVLLIILREFKNRRDVKNNLIIGLFLGLLFMTKQNVSAVVILMMTVNIFLSKDSVQNKIKMLFIRGSGCLSIVIIYMIYIYINNALYDFIDHTLLGMIDFSSNNKFIDSYIILFFLIVPFFIILKAGYLLVKQGSYSLDNKLFIVLCYSISTLSMLYPIFDGLHLSIGILLSFLLISFIYQPARLPSKRLLIICFSIILLNFLSVVYSFFKANDKTFYHPGKFYQYTMADKNVLEHLNEVNRYINARKVEGYNIMILDTISMLYLFDSGIYNERFDMLVQGNLGYKGEKKITEKIKRLNSNTLFLVSDIARMQETKSLKVFVRCHYDYIEKVSTFSVYRKPEKIEDNPECTLQAMAENVN